jgi:hypothetical protein
LKGTAASVGAADTLQYEKYSCHEGFENAFPDVKLWASLEVHFLKCDSICAAA